MRWWNNVEECVPKKDLMWDFIDLFMNGRTTTTDSVYEQLSHRPSAIVAIRSNYTLLLKGGFERAFYELKEYCNTMMFPIACRACQKEEPCRHCIAKVMAEIASSRDRSTCLSHRLMVCYYLRKKERYI